MGLKNFLESFFKGRLHKVKKKPGEENATSAQHHNTVAGLCVKFGEGKDGKGEFVMFGKTACLRQDGFSNESWAHFLELEPLPGITELIHKCIKIEVDHITEAQAFLEAMKATQRGRGTGPGVVYTIDAVNFIATVINGQDNAQLVTKEYNRTKGALFTKVLAGEKSHTDIPLLMKDDLRTAMENMLSSLTQDGMMKEEGKFIKVDVFLGTGEDKVTLNGVELVHLVFQSVVAMLEIDVKAMATVEG
ncbi:hypothetical protein TrRE_jg3315 [Triparma retinervis]|uniref:Uncharacterized protein n=1 Tax=Triparma retinervis TaxID=2557542 RepID=A0A9W7L1Z4_9STRA|nr:hypothetical protein TrRE_jg3315 [Triparma retinervis]